MNAMNMRRALGVLVAVLVMVAAGAAALQYLTKRRALEQLPVNTRMGGDFVLPSTLGHPLDTRTLRGKVVLLDFGFTSCPDVCPLTLSHVAQALQGVKGAAQNVRVLFVTVDPARDDLKTLNDYVANFGPEFVGLRGTPDELATLAKRYRVAYSVTPNADPAKYIVTHSSALYAFDRRGKAQILMTSLSTDTPDIKGTTEDLNQMVADQR